MCNDCFAELEEADDEEVFLLESLNENDFQARGCLKYTVKKG
jgi:hypothetical protein